MSAAAWLTIVGAVALPAAIRTFVHDRRGYLRIAASVVRPATADGAEFGFDVGYGGQFHVLMVGLDEAAFEVEDANGYAVATFSVLDDLLRLVLSPGPDIPFAMHMFHANALDEMTFRVKGTGCTAVIVIEQD